MDEGVEVADQPPVIRARGLTRSFGRRDPVHALGPVDLDVARGEFVSLVGPSGCGKSTLLRIAARLLRPTDGFLELTTSSALPSTMVFQDYGIFPWQTVVENIAFGIQSTGLTKRQAKVEAADWVLRLGLGGFEDAYPHTLSGGMQQRVAIARAMAAAPDLLLLDEPFAALDTQMRTLLQEEFLALSRETSMTALLVTHSLAEAILLSDRVVVMSARPGRILEIRHVPFERPRSADVRNDPQFLELQHDLWDRLRVEVERQMAEQAEVVRR